MSGTSTPGAWLAAAFESACRAELLALKPGNVHVHAAGHGMTVADLERSAAVAAPALAAPGQGVGARILRAVTATRAAVGQNTNLGIVLLAAPLVAAAQAGGPGAALGSALAAVLRRLSVEDAVLAYRAIRLAAPGGLGASARHDVADEPAVDLLEAMREAAPRDRIAFQYAHGFVDVLGRGRPRLEALRARGWPEPWAVAGTYLGFLARHPDLHILRRHGAAVALAVRQEALSLERRLLGAALPEAMLEPLLAFDRKLKQRRINPGTSADLTVASHLAATLSRRDARAALPEPRC